MKIQNSIKAAIAALLVGAASQATATVVPVTATVVPVNSTGAFDSTKLLTSGSYAGNFDLSFLPGQFNINNIGFSLTFKDNTDDPYTFVYGTPVKTSSSTVTGNGNDLTINTINTTTTGVTKMRPQESVQLSLGSLLLTGQTAGLPVASTDTKDIEVWGTVYTSNGGAVICTQAEADEKNSKCKKTTTYTIERTVTNTTTTDYTGSFEIAKSLLTYDALLADLTSNKSLGFTFGLTGDLYLTSALLNIDYTDTTPPTPPTHNVPEPGSLALFGIALMGVAGIRRARRG